MLKEISDNIFSFKHKCVRCGNCCTMISKGVPVLAVDVKNMADGMNMPIKDFKSTYCESELCSVQVDGKIVKIPMLYLKTISNCCVFYDNGCRIHKFKPYNCSAAPVISILFQNNYAIEYFKNNCKGYGKGTYYSEERIIQILNREINLELEEYECLM